MRKRILPLILALLLYNNSPVYCEKSWLTVKSTHFFVHYRNAPSDFIEDLVEKSEEYYDKIAEDLGFRRYDFWLWDNRAKIYIYDDAEEYQAQTGQPSWSIGSVVPKDKIIHAFPGVRDFFTTVLPHEMGHIIFREFVGFDNSSVPLWLDEGVARYQERARYMAASRILKRDWQEGRLISLPELSNFNPRLVNNPDSVNLFYAEAIGVVEFLIKEFGKDKFVYFCQNIRDKKNLNSAISSTYPFKDLLELDKAWKEYLDE